MPSVTSDQVIISVISDEHSAKGRLSILDAKQTDIRRCCRTFYFNRSEGIDPASMANLGPLPVYFVTPALSRKTDSPTRQYGTCSQFSSDRLAWTNLPQGLNPVTGYMRGNYYAIVMDELVVHERPDPIDLWDYSYADGRPIRFGRHVMTVLAVRKPRVGMRSHIRTLVATGRLCDPSFVYVR
jgi:hypothetical protein